MTNIYPKPWKTFTKEKKQMFFYRSQADIDSFEKKAQKIIQTVQKEGEKALVKYIEKYDGVSIKANKIRVTKQEFDEAEKILPQKIKTALQIAIRNVFNYHNKLHRKRKNILSEVSRGVFAGEQILPINSVGLYVPHGKGCFPSTTYMLAIPAQIVQVPRRVMITPPNKDGKIDPACLFVAQKTNIHEVYKMGGAHAIAALAFGTKTISPVEKIIGPCSAFVSAAKQFISKFVSIGPPAGPSESIILADGTTSPYLVAFDICIEAEHGVDSMSILITHKKEYAKQVCKYLSKIIDEAPLKQKKILETVFNKYHPIITTENEESAIQLCNAIAPEHLMIHSQSPSAITGDIKTAGEILMGEHSVFSLANYAAGPNAIIPTGGMSRTFSPVSIDDFLKQSSIIKISKEGRELLSFHVKEIAEYEGFYFHKKALVIREELQ